MPLLASTADITDRPPASRPAPLRRGEANAGQPRAPQNGQGRPAPAAHPAPANWAQARGTQEADETKKWRQQNSARMPAARRPRTPPRGSSPPPTASGGNQTRPGGQNPTRAAKRPQLEQRDSTKRSQKVPGGCFGVRALRRLSTCNRVSSVNALFYAGPSKHGGRAGPRPPGPVVFSGSLWPSGAPGNNPTAKSERVIFVE